MTTGHPRASIIIPAHDEATTIGRLLGQIADLGPEYEVIVVANGCSDETAAVAASFAGVRVVETQQASKTVALNTGDSFATAHPRVYLDADVSVSSETLRELVRTLETDLACVASPHVVLNESGASVLARAYQRIWALTDYRLEAHTGSGIYGFSRTGRARFTTFPNLIADDLYARTLFEPDERVVSVGDPFVIHAPKTLRAQIGRLRRTMAGELQLAAVIPAQGRVRGSRGSLTRRVLRRPWLWPAFVVYCTAYVLGRREARKKLRRGEADVWERDLTSR
jgi:glycosyltransferase involved in cell wall biosynthesis